MLPSLQHTNHDRVQGRLRSRKARGSLRQKPNRRSVAETPVNAEQLTFRFLVHLLKSPPKARLELSQAVFINVSNDYLTDQVAFTHDVVSKHLVIRQLPHSH